MTSRRKFLVHSVAGTMAVGLGGAVSAGAKRQKIPRTAGVDIKSVVRRDATLLRLGGTADNFNMSWAQDDTLFVAMNDGWLAEPKDHYNSRIVTLSGTPQDAKFHNVAGYPDLRPPRGEPRYYGFGTLALDGRVYQFLSTWNHAGRLPDGSAPPGFRFIGAKLIYSPDNGRTWRNQDGSTPVVWEGWQDRSRKSLVFFEEDQDAFSQLSVLQMGRNYEHNRDGFVYVYAPNGNTEGTMNELVLFRVPKAQILNRSAYEYFAGVQSSGEARWSADISVRKPVCTFPRGWVNTNRHPWAWRPSLSYNAPLGLYMMANWATGPGPAPDREWFQKPSYLGFWVAPNPWGPWRQIHEETAWLPGGDAAARCYSSIIAPKWIAADGKSFWLAWSDFQTNATPEFRQELFRRPTPTPEDELQVWLDVTRTQPNYQFNIQRVDLVTA